MVKYYSYEKMWNRYRITKKIGNKQLSYGTYATEEEAQKVVDKLKQVNWDKKQLPGILEELNISSKIRKNKG